MPYAAHYHVPTRRAPRAPFVYRDEPRHEAREERAQLHDEALGHQRRAEREDDIPPQPDPLPKQSRAVKRWAVSKTKLSHSFLAHVCGRRCHVSLAHRGGAEA